MLIKISQFLLQPDRLLLVIHRRRKLAQLSEKKWLLHNCNFTRKAVTQPPHKTLGDDGNQALSKPSAPSNAGVKVWAEEPNKKGAAGEYNREDMSMPCSHSFPFYLSHKCTGKTPLVPKSSLSSALIFRVHSFHVYFLSNTIPFSLGKPMRTFCAFFLVPLFLGKARSKTPTAFEFILALQTSVESLLMIRELQKIETRILYLFICWTQGFLCFKPKLWPQQL